MPISADSVMWTSALVSEGQPSVSGHHRGPCDLGRLGTLPYPRHPVFDVIEFGGTA
jgi:hypothetical protein